MVLQIQYSRNTTVLAKLDKTNLQCILLVEKGDMIEVQIENDKMIDHIRVSE